MNRKKPASWGKRKDGQAYPKFNAKITVSAGNGESLNMKAGRSNNISNDMMVRANNIALVNKFNRIVGDDNEDTTTNEDTKALTRMLRKAGLNNVEAIINKNPKSIRDIAGGNSLLIKQGDRWIASIVEQNDKLGIKKMDGVESEFSTITSVVKAYLAGEDTEADAKRIFLLKKWGDVYTEESRKKLIKASGYDETNETADYVIQKMNNRQRDIVYKMLTDYLPEDIAELQGLPKGTKVSFVKVGQNQNDVKATYEKDGKKHTIAIGQAGPLFYQAARIDKAKKPFSKIESRDITRFVGKLLYGNENHFVDMLVK